MDTTHGYGPWDGSSILSGGAARKRYSRLVKAVSWALDPVCGWFDSITWSESGR
jgi:hypothetical protein